MGGNIADNPNNESCKVIELINIMVTSIPNASGEKKEVSEREKESQVEEIVEKEEGIN